MFAPKPPTKTISRKEQILRQAIEILATKGYAELTMRALARASGIKLGALQYHFRTREDMLNALANYIFGTYQQSFETFEASRDSITLQDVVTFILDDAAGNALQADRLFPQLWAMAGVEPQMAELLDEICTKYHALLKTQLVELGSEDPDGEALALMSLIEGSTLFTGRGRRWEGDATKLRKAALAFINARYADHRPR